MKRWETVHERLLGDIRAGALRSGDRLPSDFALAGRFGVNRHTVRLAIKALESDGLLRVQMGVGTFVADAFLSHVPESGAHLPGYRSWLDEQDFAPAYDYLHRMLQFLQWQKWQQGRVAQRWVLKSPAHLGYLDVLRDRFPDLHIVHMHRDPRTTIASGASLNATLHAMHADTVDLHRVGAQWLQRMGWTNDRAMAVRDGWALRSGRDTHLVTDIAFDDAVADPIGQVARVYDAVGLPLTAEAENAMRRWLIERPREAARPPYALEDYGLRPEQVDERFALYNKRFRHP